MTTDHPKPKVSAGVRADQLCYARQYEWQSTFTFSRPKLKELIEVEIRAAEDAARLDERHKINDVYQKGWREGRKELEHEAERLRQDVSDQFNAKCDIAREIPAARAEGRREALDLARRILRDWTTNYAPTECLDHDVEELKRRIKEAGGTVMLIANYNAAIRALAPSEKEKDDGDSEL